MARIAKRNALTIPAVATRPSAVIAARPLVNLAQCVADAKAAIRDPDPGPPDPHDFPKLMSRLPLARKKLAPIYQTGMFDPYLHTLNGLGQAGFEQVLASDPNDEGQGRLMMDMAQALLQPAEGFQHARHSELVSDLCDGFLSAEDRAAVKKPDRV
jgi:hypothetical protein